MKFKVLIIIVMVTFALITGCATTAKFEENLRSWVGADINRLIMSWGPPSNEYTMPNGNIAYTWLYVAGQRVYANYNYYLNSISGGAVTVYCKITMITNTDGVITYWRWEGNACRAR